MSEDFDKFIQGELESFRRTCDADLDKMEILEQVSSQPYHDDPTRCSVLMDVVGVQRATSGPGLGLFEVSCCGSLTACSEMTAGSVRRQGAEISITNVGGHKG